jgi:TolB protein
VRVDAVSVHRPSVGDEGDAERDEALGPEGGIGDRGMAYEGARGWSEPEGLHDPMWRDSESRRGDLQLRESHLAAALTQRLGYTGAPEAGRPSSPYGPEPSAISYPRRFDREIGLRIPLRGSLQNPVWSPDGQSIAFTRFRNGYNKGPADIFVYNLASKRLSPVVADGRDNVTQPGSAWNSKGQIVYASNRSGHEEIWIATPGQRPRQVTSRSGYSAIEPSFAPSGRAVVFESHRGDDPRGQITIYDGNQRRYVNLTAPNHDCRQPNWSPRGDHIVYQRRTTRGWDAWLCDLRTGRHRPAVPGVGGSKTDATFSPDGRYVLYSGHAPGRDGDQLLAAHVMGGRPIPITRVRAYHGAPSWSPNGRHIAMEASVRDPGRGTPTRLVIATA